MFRATLQDISMLKDSLDSISSLITEGSFRINKNGIELIAMDPASVAMVIFKIFPSAFLDYECDKEEIATLNLSNLVSVLKRAKANDRLILELAENKFKITMIGDFKRKFSLPLIETPYSSQKIPDLSFNSTIELYAGVLKDGIKDASMVSDCIVFEANSNFFSVSSFGELSETRLELTKDSPTLISIDSKEKTKAKYSIDYLERMLKGLKSTDKIKLSFSTDYPVRIDCVRIDKFQLSFILAPRVDAE